MSISSNSVIHYTNSLEKLKGIIKSHGFKLKYCLEDVHINDKKEFSTAIPMVSFCDIPLSDVKNHINSYGSFGIGLYKSWAKTSGLNPVLYLENNSSISKSILNQYHYIKKNRQNLSDEQKKSDTISFEYFKILMFCKNYEGTLKHGEIDTTNYRFYDEREWRYIPEIDEFNMETPFLMWGKKYLEKKEEFNKKLSQTILKFQFSDISYIIVDNESEIPEILSVLNEVFEDICTSKELKILGTRIITKNQIYHDF